MGTSEPGNSTQTSGSSNVPVLQIHASNQSNAPTTLTSLKLTASGSANDASGISGVSLYLDANNDGVLDNGDSLLSTGTYPLDNGVLTLNFTSGIGAFGTANYLVAYNFSGSAPAGTYQANVVGNSDVTGVNGATGQPVVVTGAPLGGAVITIVQVTATPTSTSTPANTSTPTITSTPTPQTHSVIHIPYPNPVENGPVEVDLEIPGTERVQWSVFTLSFRKILGGEKSITGTGSIEWDLTDKSGSRVADGLYYLRLEVSGIQPTVKIFKIIVLR